MPPEINETAAGTAAATPVTPAPSVPEKSSDTAGGDDSAKTFTADYVKELRVEAAKWRTEFRSLETKLSSLEQTKTKAEKEELEKQGNFKELLDKQTKEYESLKAELEKERLGNLRLRIGSELGLSPALQTRLMGSTEDELRADAKALAEALGLDKPKADAPAATTPAATPDPTARRQTTAVVPDGKPTGETDDQRRARLYARGAANSPLFRAQSQ